MRMARRFWSTDVGTGLKQVAADLVSPWRRLPDLSLAVGASEMSRKISRQQFRALIHQPLASAAEPVVGSAVWLGALWFLEPGRMAFFWSLLIATSIAAQIWENHRYLQTMPSDEGLRPLEARTGRNSWLSGVAWGSMGFAFPGVANAFAPYMAIGLLLVVAGSLSLMASYRPAITWIPVPCAALTCLSFFKVGGFLNCAIGIGFVIAVVLMIRLARKQNTLITQAMLASEERVALLAELEQQRAAAQEATEAKTRFLATISHDLRQPMHSIALLTSAFRQQSGSQGDVAQQIGATVQAMDDMLGALADVSKLDDGAVPLQVGPVSIAALFERIEMQFAAQARHKGIALQVVASEARVVSDAYHLQRMLANLVSNAIRYTAQGRVVVRCRLRGPVAWLQVWDSGLGIERSDRQRIFQAFVQLARAPRAGAEGLGLGLSIVRRAAERLKHPIVLRSRPRRGSMFAIGLALDAAPRPGGPSTGDGLALQALLQGQMVLLIDDDPVVLNSMQTLLKAFDCHVLAAHSTASALAGVEASLRTPDLIVSDYRLGGEDSGTIAIAQVRSLAGEAIPALLITAEMSAARAAAQPLGVAVLAKPLQVQALTTELNRALPSAAHQTGAAPV
jgi:signal transduction histidine kinase/CheY-like chemotaxis protein